VFGALKKLLGFFQQGIGQAEPWVVGRGLTFAGDGGAAWNWPEWVGTMLASRN